jgi:hypothetical protein
MSNKHLFVSAGKAARPDTHNEAGGSAYAFSPRMRSRSTQSPGPFTARSTQPTRSSSTALAHRPARDTRARRQDRHLLPRERPDEGHAGVPRRSPRGPRPRHDDPCFPPCHRRRQDAAQLRADRSLRSDRRKSFGSAPKRALVPGSRAARPTSSSASRSASRRPCRTSSRWFALPRGTTRAKPMPSVRPSTATSSARRSTTTSSRATPRLRGVEARDRSAARPALRDAHRAALSATHWKERAGRMTTTQLRVNLDTLLRHGVLAEPEMVADVAARLSDRENIRRARMMP